MALLALAQGWFEHRLPVADAREHKTWRLGRAAEMGALIDLSHAANPAQSSIRARHDPFMSRP
jgi:hypothetical protein